jgi:glycosyltransferase involved in cell wall biosynthesis
VREISSVSVVIPAYNEEENIRTLLVETVAALKSINVGFEIILVDDGSEDNTFSIMKEFAHETEKIVGIRHMRRRGKSMALQSGFARAKGEAVVTMDADLQYDPWEISRLLNLLDKGYDVVNGYRDFSKYVLGKTILSRFYNELSRRLLGSREVHDLNCGLKAFRKEVIKQLLAKFVWRRGVHRYLINFCTALGYKVTEVRVSLKPRSYGRSKYGLKRILEGVSVLFILFIKIRLLNFKHQVLFRT